MIVLPAFSYLYTGREFPGRGIIAWAALGEMSSLMRGTAVAFLAQTLSISPARARALLHQGDGIFWRLYKRHIKVYSTVKLWRRVAGQSVVSRGQRVAVPPDVLPHLAKTRADLAQAALTRGEHTPVSVAASANMLGRARRTVTTYRQFLLQDGKIAIIPQWRYKRDADIRNPSKARPLSPGEFCKGGNVFQRSPDLVVILNSLRQPVPFEVNPDLQTAKAQQRYFNSMQDFADCPNPADDALLRVHGESTWEPVRTFSARCIRSSDPDQTIHRAESDRLQSGKEVLREDSIAERYPSTDRTSALARVL